MLFLLKNINDGTVFYLINKKEFVIGRKCSDFIIQNDKSISRQHALLRIKDDHCILQDLGSTYKTRHRGIELTEKVETRLENNDDIQFGIFDSQFKFLQENFVTTGTRLSNDIKFKLKKELDIVSGKYVENWYPECTHLTVEELTMTLKVLHALIDNKPIVIPSYWTKLVENVQNNLWLPNIDEYNKPPISEALLHKVELRSNISRKTLFKGKMFIFLKDKNKRQMEDVIRKAGGTPISWEKNPMPLEDIINTPKEFLIIHTPDQGYDSDLNTVIKYFAEQGKRTIPLQEIAMAIVLGSCEKDCNPCFDRAKEVFRKSKPKEPTQNNALVPNTESEYFNVEVKKDDDVQVIIPDTLENPDDLILPVKMELEHEELYEIDGESGKRNCKDQGSENPFKRFKLKDSNNVSAKNNGDQPTYLSKKVSMFKRKAESDADEPVANENTKMNPFAFLNKKAKCESAAISKKTSAFHSIGKQNETITQISDRNPFKLSAGRKETVDDISTNSKEELSKRQRDQIYSSTRTSNMWPDETANISKISKIDNEINNTWHSKKSSSNENIEYTLDPEMQNFVDLFKNKVIVETMITPLRRSVTKEYEVDGRNVSKRKNFKRFKKVLPIRPQTIIIGNSDFIPVVTGNATGICGMSRIDFSSDEETNDNLKRKKKRPKNFYI